LQRRCRPTLHNAAFLATQIASGADTLYFAAHPRAELRAKIASIETIERQLAWGPEGVA